MSVMAMVKIGKPSMVTLVDALLGKDEDLLTFAKGKVKEAKDAPGVLVRSAVLVIGTIGRADGVEPMMMALSKVEKNDYATQAIIARELPKLPVSAESQATYTKIFESMPPSAVIPPGHVAVQVLAEDIARFYDRALVDTLIKRVDTFKGDKEDKEMMRDSVLPSMIKLMRADQVETVERFIDKWAPGKDEAKAEKEALKQTKALLTECGEKVECYLAKLEDPGVQEKDKQFIGIKAAYMLAMLGNESTRLEIVKRFPNIKNAAIKYTAGLALEYLTPKGDQGVADAIGELLKANIAKGDPALIQGDNPLRQIRFRLLARL